jgi:Flp pilus assembly pilin Flp
MCSRFIVMGIGPRLKTEDGQDLLEYGLLTSLIAMFLIGTLTAAGRQIDVLWTFIAAAP